MLFLFEKEKKLNEVRGVLRQIVDRTTPALPPLEGDQRSETRVHRALPVLLVPLENRIPIADEAAFAITKDFSDRGVSVVLPQPFRAVEVIVGFWVEGTKFLRGIARQNTPLGGGFWQLGIEFDRLVAPTDEPHWQQLQALAFRLVPPK